MRQAHSTTSAPARSKRTKASRQSKFKDNIDKEEIKITKTEAC